MSPKVGAVQGAMAGFLCPVETALKMAQLAALGLVVYLVALVGVQIMVLVGILVAAPELTLAVKLSDIVAVELLVVEIPLAVAALMVVVVMVLVVVARVVAVVTAIPTSTTSSTIGVALVVIFVVVNVLLVTVLVNMAILDVDITNAAEDVMVVWAKVVSVAVFVSRASLDLKLRCHTKVSDSKHYKSAALVAILRIRETSLRLFNACRTKTQGNLSPGPGGRVNHAT